ncbi:MAG: SAM-dependent methyltransferase [Bacteroidales bacterium]|nr:SAM-dependent methyltransferase [Candidatus Physcousia equi]
MNSILYLIPVDLGSETLAQVLPDHNTNIVNQLRHFIVEDIRSARRFLRRMNHEFPIDDCTFYEMGKHADPHRFREYLQAMHQGMSMGVISEAGCPAVADPGADIVAIAQREGMQVTPLVGPSSMILSVMASGLGGQSFAFNGYLPVDSADRAKRLKTLESRAWNEGQTQLFIETPYRNHKLFQACIAALRPQTRLCIAAGITTPNEWIRTRTIEQWKKTPLPDLAKTPAVFLINR